MGFLDGLFGRAAVPATSTASQPGRGPIAPPYLDGTSAAGINAVWRCVTLIADVLSDMPWTEWRGDEQLQISRLVRRPMESMTRREWVWRVVATEALYNVVYLLHVGGRDSQGAPWSLLPVPPGITTPIGRVDPWGLLPPERYMIGSLTVGLEDLTIIRRAPWPGVMDNVSGVLQIARREFESFLAADLAANRYWTAGGPTTAVITTDQELDDPQAEAIARRWQARRSMGGDYPAVLGKGATAEPWGADPTSESAVDARREMVADVGRYFGVPTRILNAPAGDSETYSNNEHDAIDLERYTLRGYAGPVEDGISENLPGDYLTGRRMRMDSSRFTQGDLQTRSQAYSVLVGAGIVTVPEARVRGFGLAPDPGNGQAALIAEGDPTTTGSLANPSTVLSLSSPEVG